MRPGGASRRHAARSRVCGLPCALVVCASVVLVLPLDDAAAAQARARTALLGVTVVGLPRGVQPAVRIDGPHGFHLRLVSRKTTRRVAPGRYSITAARLRTRAESYDPMVRSTKVTLIAGKRSAMTVRYRRVQIPAPTPP